MTGAVQTSRCALIMAGGTGGHIFPGLAVADALRERGWRVHWLGNAAHMEGRLVPPRGYAFESVEFGGVRGKGWRTLAGLPWRLLRAMAQSHEVLRRVQPQVVIGLGGYITVPAGVVAALTGRRLVLHEQNSVPGLSNRLLAGLADRVYTAFPNRLRKASWVGNPLRKEFMRQAPPAQRFAGREGRLRLLVVGGSLGARALNEVVPRALALIPESSRPHVIHQSGTTQIDELRARYAEVGVEAELTPFIEDPAQAYANADLIVCRAGASTVTEIAAVGAAAVFVPFPAAVDDHQTANARYLTDAGAGSLLPQSQLNPERLSALLVTMDRSQLLAWAESARRMARLDATEQLVRGCEELAQ